MTNEKRIIDTPNFKGQDRRNGNGRVKLSMRDWYLLLTVIIATTLWLGKLQWMAAAQEKKIEKVEEAPKEIALIHRDIKYIKEDVGELKEDMGDIKKNIRTILEKM